MGEVLTLRLVQFPVSIEIICEFYDNVQESGSLELDIENALKQHNISIALSAAQIKWLSKPNQLY